MVNHITIGEKIRLIRTFRNMTQKELGVAIEFDEKGADNQIAQYETNYRVPKKDILYKIVEALKVNSLNFVSEMSKSAEDIMQTFFCWMKITETQLIFSLLFVVIKKPSQRR